MKNNLIRAAWGLFVIAAFSACEDVFERNLKKDDVTVLSPPDNYTTTDATITFWWEEVKGADDYRVQIVSPGFSSIQKVLVDSFVNDDKFVYTLTPGTYQWRVRAENNSSYTDYATRTLIIDSTSDLSNQVLLVNSPDDNYYTNQTQQIFRWEALYNADEYRIQIAKPAFTGNYTTVTDAVVTTDSFVYTLSEGSYEWRVRGQNATSNTAYSTRSITVDLTAPSAPALVSPGNDSTLLSPVDLVWKHDASAWGDTLYVYSDSLVTEIVKSFMTDTMYSFSSTSGSYFWRVKTLDSAGNASNYSSVYKFIIQ